MPILAINWLIYKLLNSLLSEVQLHYLAHLSHVCAFCAPYKAFMWISHYLFDQIFAFQLLCDLSKPHISWNKALQIVPSYHPWWENQGDINCGPSSHPDFIKNYFLSHSPFPPIPEGRMEQLMWPWSQLAGHGEHREHE